MTNSYGIGRFFNVFIILLFISAKIALYDFLCSLLAAIRTGFFLVDWSMKSCQNVRAKSIFTALAMRKIFVRKRKSSRCAPVLFPTKSTFSCCSGFTPSTIFNTTTLPRGLTRDPASLINRLWYSWSLAVSFTVKVGNQSDYKIMKEYP